MALFLGIDTGGTYTDAVLFHESRGVVAHAKALTTRGDLSVGIENALTALPAKSLQEVEMVSLSTTLATNAIVEGQGSRVCLILIGYPEDALGRAGLGDAVSEDPVVFVRGGHLVDGEEKEPLDEDAVLRAIGENKDRVAAFAVSGYFGVKNPIHENRVRQLVREGTGKPVTCGHELTSNLHASRRALTAAFNARLIPLLQNLILSVRRMLEEKKITAPLMVVKGDGSLMESHFALEYPIETILSGPAASVVGATFLSGLKNSVVADIGGTTTDVAILEDGRPVLNTEGARIGVWQTMVEAVRIYTCGLGGDSFVRFSRENELLLGPQRVVPLCLLAMDHPEVIDVLASEMNGTEITKDEGIFVLPLRNIKDLDFDKEDFSRVQRSILTALDKGVASFSALTALVDSRYLLDRDLKRLVAKGIVSISAFTPSDASHVLGYQSIWSKEAALLAAKNFAWKSGYTDPDDYRLLCRRIVDLVCAKSATAVLSACLYEGYDMDIDKNRELLDFFSDIAFSGNADPEKEEHTGLIKVNFGLTRKLVGIGAPAATYYPRVGKLLGTETVIPRYAEVANAVGAVAGNVIQKAKITIVPRAETGGFRAHCEEGIQDFMDLEEAVRFAEKSVREEAESRAMRAGAETLRVQISREDRKGQTLDGEILIQTEITAVAAGRPRAGRSR
jgi:N-methylhydantoinase A/oxoprolinase/acetone carboxylase beta subunit